MLPIESAVHVRDRVAGNEVRRDHLVEAVRGAVELAETDCRGEGSEEHRQGERDEEDDGERPPREAGVAAVVCRLRDGVRQRKDDEVPPAGDLLVNLHLLVMRVMHNKRSLVPWVERLQEGLDVLPVPEENVREGRAEGQVRSHEVEGVGGGEERGAKLRVLGGVELAVRQKCSLVVLGTIGSLYAIVSEIYIKCGCATHKDGLRHEGEVLGAPQVAVVDTGHEDVREEDSYVLVNLKPERVEQTVAADQVPVEAPREQTHALVVGRATEDVSEHGAVVIGQAEDRNAGEQGEHP